MTETDSRALALSSGWRSAFTTSTNAWMPSTHVLIIGAGPSGAAAASRILSLHPSARVTLLESADRVGGRTLSGPLSGGGATCDLGGQWLGSRQSAALSVARDLDLTLHPQYCAGRRVLELRNAISTYTGLIPNVSIPVLIDAQLLLVLVDIVRFILWLFPAGALARWADATTVDDLTRRVMWTIGGRVLVGIVVQGLFGCEPSDLSVNAFCRYVNASGSVEAMTECGPRTLQEWTVVGGTQQLTSGLLSRAGSPSVLLGHRVTGIHRRDGGGVRVDCEVTTSAAADGSGMTMSVATLDADFIIAAIPPPRAAAITFDPPLDAARVALMHGARMGGIIKSVAAFETAFWRAEGFSGEVIADTSNGDSVPVFNVFDNCVPASTTSVAIERDARGPAAGIRVTRANGADGLQPSLVIFINGERAREWSARPPAERRAAVLAQLARYFGPRVLTPVSYVERDWVVDAHTGGCPIASYNRGVLGAFGLSRKIAEPEWHERCAAGATIARLHFAGTEAATESTGFIDGAIRAGWSAADAVVRDAATLARAGGITTAVASSAGALPLVDLESGAVAGDKKLLG